MLLYAQRVYASFTGPLAYICEWKHVCCLMHFYVKVYGLFVCYFEISQKTVVSTDQDGMQTCLFFYFLSQAALKVAARSHGSNIEEIAALQTEAEVFRTFIFRLSCFYLNFFHVMHLSYQCVFLNFCNKLFQFWLRLLGMKQQLLWRHCNIRRMKLDHFETGPREWYWLRKRWFWIFPHLSMFFFIRFYLVFSTCFCHSYMICSYRFRKKLF